MHVYTVYKNLRNSNFSFELPDGKWWQADDFSASDGALLPSSAGASALVPPFLDTIESKLLHPSTETDKPMFLEDTVAKGDTLGRVSAEDLQTKGKQLNHDELHDEVEKKFNPSGRTYDPSSRKRAAAWQGGTRRDAASLAEATPEQERSSKALTLKVTPEGNFLIADAHTPSIVTNSDVLFAHMGHFSKTEAEAKMEMKQDVYFFGFALTGNCDQEEAPENDNSLKDLLGILSIRMLIMKTLLAYLGPQGEAGFKLPLHELKLGSDGTWSIKSTETSCHFLDYKKPAASAENLVKPAKVEEKKMHSESEE